MAVASGDAGAAVIFSDEFNGSAIDPTIWRLPQGPGTFFGRTQIKPPSFGGQDLRPTVANGVVTLSLDTHNASALTPGDSFWGHEIQSLQNFSVGDGLEIEARIRFVDGATSPGIVGGFFTFGVDGTDRDEIDFELLGNELGDETIFTNVFDNPGATSAGDNQNVSVPGLDLTAWNTYQIHWLPHRIEWRVNGAVVRERLGPSPTDVSELRLNLWAPAEGFALAYDASLQPASTVASNERFEMQVDYVRVSAVPVPAALWLFGGALGSLVAVRRRVRRRV